MSAVLSDSPVFHQVGVTYLPSLYCDLHCRHCGFASLSSLDGYEEEVEVRLFQELPDHIDRVTISGGEPLAFPDRTLRQIRLIRNSGRASQLVTSGSRFLDARWAENWLGRAIDAGLDLVALSVDSYHRPQIPVDALLRIVRLMLDSGLLVYIKGIGGDDRRLTELREAFGHRSDFATAVYELEPVGRARRLEQKQVSCATKGCLNLLEAAVFPDGTVMACCTLWFERGVASPLQLGSLKKEALTVLLERAGRDYLLAALHLLGPRVLRSWLPDELGGHSAGGECGACVSIVSNPSAVSVLRERIALDAELRKELHGRAMMLEAMSKR